MIKADFDYDNEPYGSAYDVLWDGVQTVAVGSILAGEFGYPAPVQWNNQDLIWLATADDTLDIGIAYDIAMAGHDIYISGGTYRRDAEDQNYLVEVPCYWKNGVRHDRQGFPVSVSGAMALPQASDRYQMDPWPYFPCVPCGNPRMPGAGNSSDSAVALTIAIQ